MADSFPIDVFYEDPLLYFKIVDGDGIERCSLKQFPEATHIGYLVDFTPIKKCVTKDEIVELLKTLGKSVKDNLKGKRISNLIKRIEKEGILP